MKFILSVSLLALLMTAPATAQDQRFDVPFVIRNAPPAASTIEQPRPLHVTDRFVNSPDGQEALRAFHEARAAGLLPRARKAASALNDTASFNVLMNVRTGPVWVPRDFVLKVEDAGVNIWVETTELDSGNVTDEALGELRIALLESTPADSYDPNKGVMQIDEEVFGDPPNYDNDDIVDVLLYDIVEGDNRCCIIGFVHPADVNPAAQPGEGNQADVLYLDTNPTLTDPERLGAGRIFEAAAHEYQHLIHFTYDGNELTFVNEGLSEWAQVLTGYAGRDITYLGDDARYNVSLLRFNPENSSDDRQRGGLFTTYFADRLGVLEAGSITRSSANGTVGYRNVLATIPDSLTLEELLLDFHITNVLNDTALDPRYGYTTVQRVDVRATPSRVFDGRLDTDAPARLFPIDPGGVHYTTWREVEDLAIEIGETNGTENLRPVALVIQDGTLDVRALDFGNAPFTFPGRFDRITLVLAHVAPDDQTADVSYGATWTVDQSFETQTTIYDDGTVPFVDPETQDTLAAFPVGDGAQQANRFDVPDGSILIEVSVAPYYPNDFQGLGVGLGAPRDFRLHVWVDDNAGLPGLELFAMDVEDTRGNVIDRLVFKDIDLKDFEAELSNLPSPIYVGLSNIGTDDNPLIMGVTAFEGHVDDNPSFLYLPVFNDGQGAWAPFPSLLNQTGDPILADRVLPIRATFLVPSSATSSEDVAEVPREIALYPNFPNPFNPTTTLTYALPHQADVRLTVFDVLGRQVAVLVDGRQPPGEHRVQLDARAWASGLYFYRLEAAGQRHTRRMLLIK